MNLMRRDMGYWIRNVYLFNITSVTEIATDFINSDELSDIPKQTYSLEFLDEVRVKQ